MEAAQFELLKSKSVIDIDTVCFAGHSLGEYSAVGCFVRPISVAQPAELVFLRGITMETSLPRDSQNRSRLANVSAA
jgi:malonyl CoA-acyl carrier protein transacylase